MRDMSARVESAAGPVLPAPEPGVARRRFSGRGLAVAIVVALVQVAGSSWASRGASGRPQLSGPAFALLLLGPAALVFAYRWPRTAVLVTAGAALAYFASGFGPGPIVLSGLVAAYTAVVSGYRLLVWCVTGAGILAFLIVEGIAADGVPSQTVFVRTAAFTAVITAVCAIGELVRSRRARAVQLRIAQEETRRRQASEERLRLVQELHDVLGHSVSLINVQAGAALHVLDQDPEGARVALKAIRQASGEVLSEVRSMLELMRDGEAAPRAPGAGLHQLRNLTDQCAAGGLRVDVTTRGKPVPLSPTVDLAAFRIIQEALTNVIRHARVDHATVELDYTPGSVRVTVRDRAAVRVQPVAAGTGIRGMTMRAESVGGRLEIRQPGAGGLVIVATLPVMAETP